MEYFGIALYSKHSTLFGFDEMGEVICEGILGQARAPMAAPASPTGVRASRNLPTHLTTPPGSVKLRRRHHPPVSVPDTRPATRQTARARS